MDEVPRFRVINVEFGYSRLADDSLVIHRVAIVDARASQTESPLAQSSM